MKFEHSMLYGRNCFYPIGKAAKSFVEAFPHSSGKRKSLTLEQIKLLHKIGIHVEFPREKQDEVKKLLKPRRKNENRGNNRIFSIQ